MMDRHWQKVLGVLLLTGIAGWMGGQLTAQTDVPANPSLTTQDIALVDMARTFKEYREFDEMRNELKRRIADIEILIKERAEIIEAKKKMLDGLQKSSPEFDKLRAQLSLDLADFQADRDKYQQQFKQEEAEIYLEVYRRINRIIEDYAAENHIKLVMRFNAHAKSPTDAKEIMELLNQQVIYQEGLDITAEIVLRANRAASN